MKDFISFGGRSGGAGLARAPVGVEGGISVCELVSPQ